MKSSPADWRWLTKAVDEETGARILAAEAEPGEIISHEEMRRRLGA